MDLSSMSTEELAAARETASDDEKQLIDEELARRAEEDGGDESGGNEGDESGTEPDGDEAMAKADAAGGELPYGSSVLAGAFTALTTASSDFAQALKTLEQPDVKKTLTELVDVLEGARTQLSDLYSQVYPDAPPLDDSAAEPTKDAEVLKSFVAMGRDRQYRARGFLGRLKSLRSELTPAQRLRLDPLVKAMSSMLSSGSPVRSTGAAELKREVGELATLVKSLRRS